jgi:hypothetical protein
MEKSVFVRLSVTDARTLAGLLYRAWLTTYPNEEVGVTEADIHEVFKEKVTDVVSRSVKRVYALSQATKNTSLQKLTE